MRGLTRLLLLLGWLLPLSGFTATPSTAPDLQYPREFASPQGRVVTHAPQIQSWTGYEMINGVSAIEVTLPAADKPAFGAVYYTARTVTDLEAHTVTFYDISLNKVSFPQLTSEQSVDPTALVQATLGRGQLTLPLAVVLEYLDKDILPASQPGLSMAPPVIFYTTRDSRLLTFDGPPMLAPIQKTDLQFVVNTNWDLFYVDSESMWYLLDGTRWLSMPGEKLSAKMSEDDWQPVTSLPAAFNQLPNTLNWQNVKEAVPPQADNAPLPTIYISEEPAELILVTGEPRLEAIPKTGIRYVTNTESDVFLYGSRYYYLVSGRWFASDELDGKWSPVTTLPTQFAMIPPDHPRGDVRVAVAGTPEAKIATLEAVIPRKAELSRSYAPPVVVSYTDDKPQFERIEPTQVLQATNTQYVVLQTGNRFYLCYNAAWFVADEPTGPWQVAEQIPQAIYSIPATSSAYNCTHVYAYDSDADTVTTGYDSGYFNVYTSYGTTWYGTGYYYYPYYYYPYYYGYPRSYGESAWYNPRTGNYGVGQSVYGPYGGASRAAVYNPETGTYARGRAVWDDDEIARQGIAYNPRTGTGVYTNRYANEDGAWGQSLVKRDDNWVATQTERQGNSATTDFKTSGGASGTLEREASDGKLTGSGEITRGGQTINSEMVRTDQGVARKFTNQDGNSGGYVRNSEGDLYAGKDGEVYKREDGEWSKRGDDGWESIDRDAGGERDFSPQQAGADGQNRRDDLSQYRQMGPAAEPGADAYAVRPDSAGLARDDFGRAPDSRPDIDRSRESRTNQLERDHLARRDGFDRHSGRMNRGGFSGGRRGGFRRR